MHKKRITLLSSFIIQLLARGVGIQPTSIGRVSIDFCISPSPQLVRRVGIQPTFWTGIHVFCVRPSPKLKTMRLFAFRRDL